MNVLKSYFFGIKKTSSEAKMIGLLWLFNILFAAVAYFRFSDLLSSVLSGSGAADKFLKTFDMNTFFEILIHEGKGLGMVLSTLMLAVLGYLVVNIFLNGGILFTLNGRRSGEKRKRLAPLFFEGGGKFFGRFFRLFIYALIFWAGLMVFILIVNKAFSLITAGGTNESLIFWLFIVRVIIALFLIFLIKMITDYARIRIVVEDSKKVFRALFQASGYVFRKFLPTLTLYYLWLLTALILAVLYWIIKSAVTPHALGPILITFFITQIFILSRAWVRIGLQASQLRYFYQGRSLSAEIRRTSPPAAEDEAAPSVDSAADSPPDES